MSSFMEKMKDSIIVALDGFGLAADAVVPSDDMVIVMNPHEKRKDAKSTHGGYAGKTLIETIREDLDITYEAWQKEGIETGELSPTTESFVEGMCQALGTLRGTNCDEEWKLAEYRYGQKQTEGK